MTLALTLHKNLVGYKKNPKNKNKLIISLKHTFLFVTVVLPEKMHYMSTGHTWQFCFAWAFYSIRFAFFLFKVIYLLHILYLILLCLGHLSSFTTVFTVRVNAKSLWDGLMLFFWYHIFVNFFKLHSLVTWFPSNQVVLVSSSMTWRVETIDGYLWQQNCIIYSFIKHKITIILNKIFRRPSVLFRRSYSTIQPQWLSGEVSSLSWPSSLWSPQNIFSAVVCRGVCAAMSSSGSTKYLQLQFLWTHSSYTWLSFDGALL